MTNRLNAAKNSQFPHTQRERGKKPPQTPNDTRRSVSLHITHFKHIFNICRTIINNNRSQCWIESTHFCVHTAYDWCTLSVRKIQTLNTEHVSFIRSIRIVRHPMDLSGNPDFSDLSRVVQMPMYSAQNLSFDLFAKCKASDAVRIGLPTLSSLTHRRFYFVAMSNSGAHHLTHILARNHLETSAYAINSLYSPASNRRFSALNAFHFVLKLNFFPVCRS